MSTSHPSILMGITALPWHVSGAAKQAYALSGELRSRGVAVHYLVSCEVKGQRGWRTRTVKHEGETYVVVPLFRRKWTFPYSMILGFLALFRLRKQFGIFHAHGGTPLLVWMTWFARVLGRKTILKVTQFGMDTADAVRRHRSSPQYRAYRENTALVCISGAQEELLLKEGIARERLHRIPNGVRTDVFKPSGRSLVSEAETLDLFSVGYMLESKGFDIVIRALAEARARCPNLRLDIATNLSDPEQLGRDVQADLLALAERLGVSERVRFVQGEGIAAKMRAADIFVFASRSEGFGTAQIEAMASGLPSVVTRLDGVNTAIYRDGIDGFLVPQNDVHAMSERIEQLAGDPALRREMGAAARTRAEEVFSMPKIADRFRELYEQLLSETR